MSDENTNHILRALVDVSKNQTTLLEQIHEDGKSARQEFLGILRMINEENQQTHRDFREQLEKDGAALRALLERLFKPGDN